MINYYFFNALPNDDGSWDREYNADDFSNYLNLLVGSGVFPNPSTNLQVMASSGFDLVVKAGSGWIDGKKIENTTDYSLTLDGSDILLNRIDRVIFYLDNSTREMGIGVLKGTPAENPVAPDLTRTATRQEYCLATVLVSKQVTDITQADITDTRADSDVCGWVAGLIQQVDTSTLFNQWQTAYATYYAAVQQQLNDFMETLTQTLRVNTYLTQFTKVVNIDYEDSKVIPLNMQYYTYNPTDIIEVYINGLAGTPTTDFTVNTSVNPPTVTLNFTQYPDVTNDVFIRVLKTRIGIAQMVDQSGNAIVTNNGDGLTANE